MDSKPIYSKVSKKSDDIYHYFYKIIRTDSIGYYYGIHSTKNMNDGYMGSGERLLNEIGVHGSDNFIKVILNFFDNREELINHEYEFVTNEMVKDRDCYNLIRGGSFRGGKLHPRHGTTHTEETRKKMSETRKGIVMSESQKKNISKSHLRYEVHPTSIRLKGVKKAEGFGDMVRKTHTGLLRSEETKKKMSESHKGKIYTCPHCGKSGGRGLLRFHDNNCFMINEDKAMFKAISPNGSEFLTGSIEYFCKDKKISASMANSFMGKGEVFINNRQQNVPTGRNTVGWKFIQLR